jgi:multiple antibiotic resistance protein
VTWDYLAAMSRGFLFALAAILPILNPAATAPIFLSLTEAADDGTRTLLARRIARNMFLLLAGSMLVGSYVLDFFGISLPIVRVGGGLIVAATAWRLLSVEPGAVDSRAALAEAFTPEQASRQAFYPLTFPISCGPGSIAAAITVGVSLVETRVSLEIARARRARLVPVQEPQHKRHLGPGPAGQDRRLDLDRVRADEAAAA